MRLARNRTRLPKAAGLTAENRPKDNMETEALTTSDGVPPERAGYSALVAESYTPGSKRDFDRLYRSSYQRILYTVLAVVQDYQAAEDCTQEAFVRAFENWQNWRPDAPAEAWLHRIAINVALSYWRWRKLRRVGETLRRLGAPRQADEVDIGIRSDLAAALRTLPPEQAVAIVLRYQHGYSNREIAFAQGIPESTVAWRLAAAKDKLRDQLQ